MRDRARFERRDASRWTAMARWLLVDVATQRERSDDSQEPVFRGLPLMPRPAGGRRRRALSGDAGRPPRPGAGRRLARLALRSPL